MLERLTDKVKKFAKELNDGTLMADIIEENGAYILDMNAQEQLYEQGVNALGVDIMDYAPYAPTTIQIKKEKGQPYNRVTLKDEGDFYHSFFLQIDKDKFEIKANDWKTEKLIRKYSAKILGLTEENQDSLIWEFVYPDLLSILKKQIQ